MRQAGAQRDRGDGPYDHAAKKRLHAAKKRLGPNARLSRHPDARAADLGDDPRDQPAQHEGCGQIHKL